MDVLSWDGTISSREFRVAVRAFAERWKESNPDFPPWTWVPSAKRHPGLTSNQIDGYLTLERLCLTESTEKDIPFQQEVSALCSKVDASEELQVWNDDGLLFSQSSFLPIVDSFMSLLSFVIEDSYEVTQVEKEETASFEEEDPADNATLVERHSFGVHYYDFHLVHSASYRVPVLFFRAYTTDGQPLVLDEIEKDLPASSAEILLESKWTFITQEDHPHLNRPWYKLHPCGTSEWMKLLFQSDTSMANKGVAIELYIVSWLSVVGQVFGLRIPSKLLNYRD
ncbi:ubiquitin-like-conjugating enzyme ATG10 isoform X2 [Morus notabilis]|uniref:ubiquitin-like-conjugating enzyme ATG10 isoform X2 n=1 Tax=Morus notabilis TaxID=981085 RepID=UPI000CED62B3|nr:ubiquitin-like-conjugating enzyme ATG10 isoform X2 [Morus notabilis]